MNDVPMKTLPQQQNMQESDLQRCQRLALELQGKIDAKDDVVREFADEFSLALKSQIKKRLHQLDDVPSSWQGQQGKLLALNSTSNAVEFVERTFTGLKDTPGSLTANKVLAVNSAGNAIELVDKATSIGGDDAFDWATVGNTDVIPDAKLPAIPSVSAWALTADTSQVPVTKLGTGTASETTFLKGDGSWSALPASGLTNDQVNALIDAAFERVGSSYSATDFNVTYRTSGDTDTNLTTLTGNEFGYTLANCTGFQTGRVLAAREGNFPHWIDLPRGFSGNYNDLSNKPDLFSGSWTDLEDKPTLFSGAYDDLTGKPTLFSGSYNDLTDKPTLFSGSYGDLTGTPTLFSGDYDDLSGKPTIPAAQVNSDWNATSGKAQILNKPSIPGDTEIDARILTWARSGDTTDIPTDKMPTFTDAMLKRRILTQAQYDALTTKSSTTLYLITG